MLTPGSTPRAHSHKPTLFLSVCLQERMSHRLEGQQREEVLEECHALADELHQWMLGTRSALCSTPQDADAEEQLEDCQVRAPSTGVWTAGIFYKWADVRRWIIKQISDYCISIWIYFSIWILFQICPCFQPLSVVSTENCTEFLSVAGVNMLLRVKRL